MSFIYTTAVKKLRQLSKRKKIVQGGTSAGKTHGIVPILIDKAAKESRLKITIVAETLPAVKEGALDIFKEVMQDTNRWNEDGWNASSLTYTFYNGSRVQFKSFDTVGKAKAAGKRDVLFLNEANHIDYQIADALITRSKDIWIDFNADKEFWAHTELLNDHDSEFLILTYKDNEAIPEEILDELMIKKERAKNSEYWAIWWEVYGEGNIGRPFVSSPFAHEWDDKFIQDCAINPVETLYVSMDFNVEPFGFIYYQAYQDSTGFHFHILDEETINEGSINEAARLIEFRYYPWIHNMIITGDNNGNARTLSNGSYYEQLARELKIPMRNVQTSANPRHKVSRNDLNYVLYHHPDFKISPRCENTIRDLRFVEANGEGGIIKENRKNIHERADHIDCVRYAVNHKAVNDWIKMNQMLRV